MRWPIVTVPFVTAENHRATLAQGGGRYPFLLAGGRRSIWRDTLRAINARTSRNAVLVSGCEGRYVAIAIFEFGQRLLELHRRHEI